MRPFGVLTTVALLVGIDAVAQTPADRTFQRQFGEEFFDRVWQLNPAAGISVGYYKYADRLIVPDDAARTAELAQLERWSAQLNRIDPDALSPNVRADWALLDNSFKADRWFILEHRPWQWNPSSYNVADEFALLLSLEYAPLDERLRTFLDRLEKVPAYYAAAEANIENPTREHTRLAIEQNRGALGVFGDDLNAQVARSKLTSSEQAVFTSRIAAARAAIEGYVAFLEKLDADLARGTSPPRSFRIGKGDYERKFELQIQSGETAEALYRRALEEKEVLHTRMALLSDLLWSTHFPNELPPQDRLDEIGRVIARLSEEHVAREGLFDEINREIPELEQWVRDHDLLELDPAKPLRVRETPVYKRGIAGAGIDAPGPYDPDAPTYYNVTPLDDLSAEEAESYLREYNRWMLPILNIHEAVPGHYVQLVHANKSPSLIKTIYGNGAMIEGWAVYAERMMLESGFGGHTAESWLIYSKWNLRSVCNVILDYAVHVLNMSEAEAMDLLMREAFQTRQEATEKWRRVQLTSVQLTSYFSGYSAILDLRERLKGAQGASFDLKSFHQQFLSYGNAPVKLIRELMEGQAAAR